VRDRYPDFEGYVERDGIKIGYEVFGQGEPAVVFPPIDPVVSSLAWKSQVPCLARTSKVITIDPRGNGRSDRPEVAAAYGDAQFVSDTIATMDAAGVEHPVLVGLCSSAWYLLLIAARHPERVLGVVSISTWAPHLPRPRLPRMPSGFTDVLYTDAGWTDEHWDFWRADWQAYASGRLRGLGDGRRGPDRAVQRGRSAGCQLPGGHRGHPCPRPLSRARPVVACSTTTTRRATDLPARLPPRSAATSDTVRSRPDGAARAAASLAELI
jgi:pimeloyl-ACP methyl ester carboxylesterase